MAWEFLRASTEQWDYPGVTISGTAFTVSLWVSPINSTATYQGLFGAGSGDPGIYTQTAASPDVFSVYFTGDRAFDTTLLDGVWQHLVVQYSDPTLSGWYNGVKEATTHAGTWTFDAGGIHIGAATPSSGYGNAQIADVAVWDYAMGSAEIAQLAAGYSAAFFPNNRLFFAPLIREEYNLHNNTAPTADGTPTVVAHPALIFPPPKRLAFSPPAVVATRRVFVVT